MTTFLLVHGSMHGAWCWDLLRPELEQAGHAVVTPDLPCDDASAGVNEYADVVMAALDASGHAGDDRIVVVGHSLGGCTIPVVASRVRVAGLVYLCCAPLAPGEIALEAFAGSMTPELLAAPRKTLPDGCSVIDADGARAVYYNECDADLAAWATSRLRPQGPRPISEPVPFEAFPDAPIAVILAANDHAVDLAWATERARRIAGVEPIVLPGDHSPFLARPAELAAVLLRSARL